MSMISSTIRSSSQTSSSSTIMMRGRIHHPWKRHIVCSSQTMMKITMSRNDAVASSQHCLYSTKVGPVLLGGYGSISSANTSSLLWNKYKSSPPITPNHQYYSSTSITQSDNQQQKPSEGGEVKPPPFTKILIANRGEIARRIIQTCKSLQIPTVAIHSTIDNNEPHVLEADEAVCIGPPSSTDSYLNIENIIKAIRMTGATAVHPGYGFLSENADFASQLDQLTIPVDDTTSSSRSSSSGGKETNVTFIGPSVDAILAMGDKITSKQIAQDAGVNVIPGNDTFLTSSEQAIQIANEIGYPVMIKATSGGGGKGMRICYTDEEVKEGYTLSKAEAKSFFSDERVFLEKYIERPHHIEIQVLAGQRLHQKQTRTRLPPVMNPMPIIMKKGSSFKTLEEEEGELEILCFVERECSIQRRNQKVLEESPSTLLSPETRAEMIRQVKKLVRKVNYTSAGTVEFLVDEEQNFYFLEMNTRLQVEHPVTEMVSGNIDLVRGMIEVAAGWGIPQEYLDLVEGEEGMSEEEKDGLVVPYKGHAIEARIYAEDPLRGFLPSTGPLIQYIEPLNTDSDDSSNSNDNKSDTSQIRVDSGVVSGSNISQFYDPMISKLITYSPHSRHEAIQSLTNALDKYVIDGVGQNTSFISDVLRHPEFIAGSTPTNFIDVHYPEGFSGVQLTREENGQLAAIVATVGAWRREFMQKPQLPFSDDRHTNGGEGEEVIVCLGGMFGDAYSVKVCNSSEDLGLLQVHQIAKQTKEIEDDGIDDDDAGVPEEGQEISIESIDYHPCNPIVTVDINGNKKFVQIKGERSSGLFEVKFNGANIDVIIMSPKEYELTRHMQKPKVVDTSNFILSPMPGTLVSYAVDDGEHVIAGQEICIVEAMKMQNVLRSSRSGVIKIKADVGSSLMTDEIIVEFVEDEDELSGSAVQG